jgi:hypothetical protein
MVNVYFELTRELNAERPTVVLGSGQAVVYYRLALASKDGDWIVREDAAACARVLDVLGRRDARYRLSAPLDVRWLGGGWSSHFEFLLEERLRVRCDFFSRPPRLTRAEVEAAFQQGAGPLKVLGVEPLIRLKRTQRAKDYPIIAELARLLAPERELELTTDPDRIVELARSVTAPSERPCVAAARHGDAEAVELALLREMRRQREEDRLRVESYARAARPYLAALQAEGIARLALGQAHARALALAERLLPTDPLAGGGRDADAE